MSSVVEVWSEERWEECAAQAHPWTSGWREGAAGMGGRSGRGCRAVPEGHMAVQGADFIAVLGDMMQVAF